MSEFTEKWRIKHSEPLNYNERIINSACDVIDRQEEQIEELEERINYAIGGIDAFVILWSDGQAKKDLLSIKETLEQKPPKHPL